MTPRDSQIYQRLGALLRFAGGHTNHSGQSSPNSNRTLLLSADWKPFFPAVEASNGPTYASSFPSEDEVFFTVVGFGSKTTSGTVTATMSVDAKYSSALGYRLFDCYRGVELPLKHPSNVTGTVELTFDLEASLESANGTYGASGFGALLLTKLGLDVELESLLGMMRQMTSRCLLCLMLNVVHTVSALLNRMPADDTEMVFADRLEASAVKAVHSVLTGRNSGHSITTVTRRTVPVCCNRWYTPRQLNNTKMLRTMEATWCRSKAVKLMGLPSSPMALSGEALQGEVLGCSSPGRTNHPDSITRTSLSTRCGSTSFQLRTTFIRNTWKSHSTLQ